MITLEEYTEEEKKTNGNMIKGGKIHDKLCDYLDSIGYKEPIINDLSVAVWKAVDIITALKEELKRERETVDFYANNVTTVFDINGENMLEDCSKLARETQKQRKIEL